MITKKDTVAADAALMHTFMVLVAYGLLRLAIIGANIFAMVSICWLSDQTALIQAAEAIFIVPSARWLSPISACACLEFWLSARTRLWLRWH